MIRSSIYSLAFQLEAARLRRGISQRTLARKLGVFQSQIVRWENEYNFPTTYTLGNILEVLGARCTIENHRYTIELLEEI